MTAAPITGRAAAEEGRIHHLTVHLVAISQLNSGVPANAL
jgi:hypothetical protein